MNQELFELVDRYISDLLGEEDEALKDTVLSMEEAGIPPMNISANQGKFLQVLAITANAKKVLEIGTCSGYSTIWLARALPAGGKLISLEVDNDYAAIARVNIKNAGADDIAEVRVGKAVDTLKTIETEGAGPFDMIFIDADKPPYVEYFEWAIKLSRTGTIIVADNVIREGKILDENSTDEKVQGVQRLNKMLSGDERVTATVIQTVGCKYHDGMAIAVVK